MICPKCGGKVRTIETRPNPYNNQNRRRKRCMKCDYRFTTYELTAVDLAQLKR